VHEAGHLEGSACNKLVKRNERTSFDLPFAGSVDLVKKGGEYKSGGPRVHGCNECSHSFYSRCPDSGHFVGHCLKKSSVKTRVDKCRF
jgi:hypothetical protein